MGKNLTHTGTLSEFNHIQEVESLIQSGKKSFELRYSATEDKMFNGFYHIEDVEVAILDEQEQETETHKLSIRDAIVGIALNKLSKKGLKKITEKSLQKIQIN
ncbi:MAG TPA: hypothetical protein DCL21_01350 [Alphaproteobacteria bacterium]|nr:hypothetical protein [Alphaproteobacteria bacterium]